MVHQPNVIQPTWHNCRKHWSQNCLASLWNAGVPNVCYSQWTLLVSALTSWGVRKWVGQLFVRVSVCTHACSEARCIECWQLLSHLSNTSSYCCVTAGMLYTHHTHSLTHSLTHSHSGCPSCIVWISLTRDISKSCLVHFLSTFQVVIFIILSSTPSHWVTQQRKVSSRMCVTFPHVSSQPYALVVKV